MESDSCMVHNPFEFISIVSGSHSFDMLAPWYRGCSLVDGAPQIQNLESGDHGISRVHAVSSVVLWLGIKKHLQKFLCKTSFGLTVIL